MWSHSQRRKEAISGFGVFFVGVEKHSQSDLDIRVDPLLLFASTNISDNLNQAPNQSLIHALLTLLGSGLENFAIETSTHSHSGLGKLRMSPHPLPYRPVRFGSV